MGARGKLITKGNGVTVGADIYELPVDDSQPFAPYYNPTTGKVHPRLPADGYSQLLYRRKGLLMGLPPSNVVPAQTNNLTPSIEGKEDAILQLLQSMQEEIKDLKTQLAVKNNEAPDEPVQLRLI